VQSVLGSRPEVQTKKKRGKTKDRK
jgi:hypothetical protein